MNTWILRSITWRLKGGGPSRDPNHASRRSAHRARGGWLAVTGLTIAPPLLSRTYQVISDGLAAACQARDSTAQHKSRTQVTTAYMGLASS